MNICSIYRIHNMQHTDLSSLMVIKVAEGDVEAVSQLLEKGVPECYIKRGALIEEKHVPIIDRLHRNGINIKPDIIFRETSSTKVVSKLMDLGLDLRLCSFSIAVQSEMHDVTKYIANMHRDANSVDYMLNEASLWNDTTTFIYVYNLNEDTRQKCNLIQSLLHATSYGNLTIIDLLTSQTSSIDKKTIAHCAYVAVNEHQKLALTKLIDLSHQTSNYTQTLFRESIVLAAKKGYLSIVTMLSAIVDHASINEAIAMARRHSRDAIVNHLSGVQKINN